MDPKVKSLINKVQKMEQTKKTLVADVKKLQKTCVSVKKITSTTNAAMEIMDTLFLVFKQSIEETNEDKKYFLEKLKMYKEMGDALDDYLSDLVDVAHEAVDKDDDDASYDTLRKASKGIKGSVSSLESAISAVAGSKIKKKSEIQSNLSNLKNEMGKIRKSIKEDKKKKEGKKKK